MPQVLIIEDNRALAAMAKAHIEEKEGFSAVIATSRDGAKTLLDNKSLQFAAAIVDINLPDAPDGEVVPDILDAGIPAIVMTGAFKEELRDQMLKLGVVDYVVKQGIHSFRYACNLVERIHRNRSIKVLVVDDSPSATALLTHALEQQKFIVLSAESGEHALGVLEQHPDTRLVITDYNMPGMDGFELCQQIRRNYEKRQIAIIGLSGTNKAGLSNRFLKSGANDFLSKPFSYEELFCRINHNLELIEQFETIQSGINRIREQNDRLLYERELVESVLSKIRQSTDFDPEGIRFLTASVENTTGDILFSATHADGKRYFLLGDFTGHGLASALASPTVADIFYAMTKKGLSAAKILKEINYKLCHKLPTHLYLAACCVEYHPRESRISLWNCGLPDAVLFRDAEPRARHQSNQLPLGITPDIAFEESEQRMELERDDRLYVCSDGVLEVFNAEQEMFGRGRLETVLKRILSEGLSLDEILVATRSFQGNSEQHDDITLLEITHPGQ